MKRRGEQNCDKEKENTIMTKRSAVILKRQSDQDKKTTTRIQDKEKMITTRSSKSTMTRRTIRKSVKGEDNLTQL